ncbi:MAG TPA: hypothetical protein VEK73_09025 [Xanthobacteraceae bacterium]|nr:hypothetical protein [Xanthobacteraceae bacterium]
MSSRTPRFTIVVPIVGTPEFLALQLRLLRKWCADELDVLIVNDARRVPAPSNRWIAGTDRQIARMADQLAIRCYRYPQWRHGWLRFRGEADDPAIRTADVVQFGFRKALRLYPTQPMVIIDSDMFPFAPFSFAEMLADHAIAGIAQHRGQVRYLWNGLLIFDAARLPDATTIDFSCAVIKGELTDVGGMLSYYLDHHPELAVRYLGHLSSGRWGLAEMPQSLDGALRSFVVNDPYNGNGTFFSEIYEGCMFHLRSGGNWQGDPRFSERISLFLEAMA